MQGWRNLVDALDLGSSSQKWECGFESRPLHQKKGDLVMAIASALLDYSIKEIDHQSCFLTVCLPAHFVDTIYQEASRMQQEHTTIYGFLKGAAPLAYIQEHYKIMLLEHVQEFLFKFLVINNLYDAIHEKKLCTVSEPRLYNIELEPGHDAIFTFELSLVEPIEFREWKHFLFKGPKRKNYKDIDRQVESFIKEEHHLENQYKDKSIHIGDWIGFEIEVLSKDYAPLLEGVKKETWLKIGSEEADAPFQHLFTDKKKGDHFTTQDSCFQEYFSHNLPTNYIFNITIKEIVHHGYFSFDAFKHHFKLKTNKEVHQKLIEIFSYRNDISLRRGIVDEALHLLVSKHRLIAPRHLVARQQNLVLQAVQNNPDYNVYKTERTFKETVKQLATKQVAEMMLIDQLAYQEHLNVNDTDIRGYLNLLQRPRTKEFVYFEPPPTKINGQEMPIPASLIKRNCLREKALNHIIHHLTRN